MATGEVGATAFSNDELVALLCPPHSTALQHQSHAVRQILQGYDPHQPQIIDYGEHGQSSRAQLAKTLAQ